MATGLGLRIGADESVAVVATSGNLSEPEYIVRATVLHMSDDGDTVLGDAPTGDDFKTMSGFVEHVGDPEGISVDQGDAYRAEDLVATAMFCLINDVGDRLEEPSRIIASYPTEWSGATVDAVRDSLDYLGLRQVKLVREGRSGSDRELARDAALFAHDSASGALPAGNGDPGDLTEELPVTAGPMVGAQAYSTATEIPMALPPLDVPPSNQPTEAIAAAPRRNKTPLVIAAAVAAVLAVGGGAAAIALQNGSKTDVPPIRDAQTSAPQAPPSTTKQETSTPVVFAPAPQVQEPAPEPPPVVETTLPPPPPPPPVTEPPVSEPPVTTDPTTATTPTEPTVPSRPRLTNPMTIPGMRPGDFGYGN